MGLIKVMEQAAELIGDHHSFCDYISLSLSLLSLFVSLLLLCVWLMKAASSRVTGCNAASLQQFMPANSIKGVKEFLGEVAAGNIFLTHVHTGTVLIRP